MKKLIKRPSLWIYFLYGEPQSFVILYPDDRCDVFRNGKWMNVTACTETIKQEIAHKFVSYL